MKPVLFAVLPIVATLAAAPSMAVTVKPIKLELKAPDKPPVPKPDMVPELTSGPVMLELTDARSGADPNVVGSQKLEGEDVYLWRTEGAVGPAVKSIVTEVLGGWSVHVAPAADHALTLALENYFVNEKSEMFGSTYIAEVKLGVTFADASGHVLWTGDAVGDAKRPGVDARPSGCNEALSFALRRALASALSSIKVVAAPAAAPVAVPAAAPAAVAAAAPVVIDPEAMFADLQRLKDGGMAEDVLVSYVQQRKLSRPLSVDDILRWKNAGLSDAVIRAATKP